MTNAKSGQFSAVDSAMGYLYQVRVALLWALRRLPASAEFFVSLETLDDVTFESIDGTPQDLLQTKHHLNRKATLTDASPDLWKTVRAWLEAHKSGQVQSGTALHLLTTAQAPAGSAASYLGMGNRNVEAALGLLQTTAQSSVNETNKPGYALFLEMGAAKRRTVFDDIVVLDSSPTIADLDRALIATVFSAVERRHLESFLERLEGWWLRRVVRQLTRSGDRVAGDEVESQITDLREQFKQDALPIDDDLLALIVDEATAAAYADSVFVRQIALTKAARARVFAGVRDYYRAFEQRSRWMREDLLLVGELSQYERRLIEEWELVFAAMQDKCGASATSETKERLAQDLLAWAEQTAPMNVHIRPRVTEPFVTRGSLHMLSDNLRVGWHPDFRSLLGALLQRVTGAA